MLCLKPIKMSTELKKAWRITDEDTKNKIVIKCGQCKNCRLNKVRRWESRMMMEFKYLKQNHPEAQIIFTTLTYDNANLWKTEGDYGTRELQKWIKRLRGRGNKNKLKYFGVYERGGQKGRIHHHVIIFSEKKLIEKGLGGKKINGNYYWNAKDIKWDNGFNSTNIINMEQPERVAKVIKYINKYVLKEPLKYVYSQRIGYEAIPENGKPYYLFNGMMYKNPKTKTKLKLEEILEINKQQATYTAKEVRLKLPINKEIKGFDER